MLQHSPMPIVQQTFFQLATVNWKRIGRRAVVFSVIVSLFGAWSNALEWWQGGKVGLLEWGEVAFQLLLTFGAIYLSALDILGRRPTWLGLTRFVIAAVVLLLPIAATFGVLFVIKPIMPEGGRLAVLLLGLFGALATITLLPAWPLAQSFQATLISPLSVFRATRGHRWGLILVSFALGAVNKADFIPKMKTANNVGEVVLIGCGQTLMGLVSIAFTASIAATALQFAARSNARLGG